MASSIKYWRDRFVKTHSSRALRLYLMAKARAGKWDSRYCRYFHVPVPRNPRVRAFITRGFAAGLIPTATTNGVHAAESLHKYGRAADLGVLLKEVGTAKARRKLEAFQRSEFAHNARYAHTELIGPINNRVILRGRPSPLAEHTALEDAHDNHVHGAF